MDYKPSYRKFKHFRKFRSNFSKTGKKAVKNAGHPPPLQPAKSRFFCRTAALGKGVLVTRIWGVPRSPATELQAGPRADGPVLTGGPRQKQGQGNKGTAPKTGRATTTDICSHRDRRPGRCPSFFSFLYVAGGKVGVDFDRAIMHVCVFAGRGCQASEGRVSPGRTSRVRGRRTAGLAQIHQTWCPTRAHQMGFPPNR